MEIKVKQTFAQNKLLVLYLLQKSGIALSEIQIMRIMGEFSFMGYFDLKECLFELLQGGLIEEKITPQNTYYTVTAKGGEVVTVLKTDLRLSFRDSIDKYIAENKKELENESRIIGEYFKLSDNEYKVILKVLEDDRVIFEVSLVVYSKGDAQSMVDNFRLRAAELYKDVISKLT